MKIEDILRSNNQDLIRLVKYVTRKDPYKNTEYNINKNEIQRIKKLKKRIDENEPIEYIIKKAYFSKYEFLVNKNTLIPRVETQIILEYLKNYKNILDLGCGSGAVGISIKRNNLKINVTLSDISEKALYIARKNAQNLDIKIIKSDLLKNIKNINIYDCIFANLPYIKDFDSLPDSVRLYEPKIALIGGGKHGLEKIENLINQIEERKWKGDLYLEVDPFQIKYIKKKNFIIKDQYGKNRFIKIIFK